MLQISLSLIVVLLLSHRCLVSRYLNRLHNHDVMASGHGHLHGAFRLILSFDILEVRVIAVLLLQQLPSVQHQRNPWLLLVYLTDIFPRDLCLGKESSHKWGDLFIMPRKQKLQKG